MDVPTKQRSTNDIAEALCADRIARSCACLLGGAIGDALGAAIEFCDVAQIRRTFGPEGVSDYAPAYGRRGSITDDTQMTLFTAEGLLRAFARQQARGMCHPPSVVHHAYLRWLATQGETSAAPHLGKDGWLFSLPALHDRRAPSTNCLAALRAASGFGTPEVARNDSKGCGGIMRMAPVGIFAPVVRSDSEVFELACDLARLTHGHPSGYLAAGHFAVVIAALRRGEALWGAVDAADAELARHPANAEVLEAVAAAQALAAEGRPTPEDLARLGGGWVAEEALAIALCCALVADSFRDGVLLAVNHSGDSDSTGAIAGNLLGALHGAKVLSGRWLEHLELRPEIDRLAQDLARIAVTRELTPADAESYPGW